MSPERGSMAGRERMSPERGSMAGRERPDAARAEHAVRVDALRREIAAAGSEPLALGKSTSNLFRDRDAGHRRRLDVGAFTHVLEVDPASGRVDVEGMATYEALADATLAQGVMPAVVPQLRSITIGGAAAGVGIEATSFRHGLVHDTLLEAEILLADGTVVVCRPDNEHRDLFFGFPNSYGTLGYALRVLARTAPVRPFVAVRRERHGSAAGFFRALGAACDADPAAAADFVDGVVFGRDELVLCTGRFVDSAPYTSDYTFERVFYRSVRERDEDYLATRDFLWRWDTDWFWCSKNVGAQNPLVRRLLGRRRLNSVFYSKVMRWNSRVGLARVLDRIAGRQRESVIQDVDIPLDRAAAFLDFFLREIGILPVWICPIRSPERQRHWPLYPVDPAATYVNFGFWDVVSTRARHEPGHFNRLVERRVAELGGIKSLYSDSFFSREEFDRLYGGETYAALKRRYDPQGRLPGLYEKCVLRH
jgi:FAD/FMN-containing dehydrogenase